MADPIIIPPPSAGGNYRLTELPNGKRAAIFRALIELVKSYEPLKKEVKLWIEGLNMPQDRTPYALQYLPAVRFRPYTIGISEIAVTRRRYLFGVYVDVFTPGLNFDDFLNLWECIEDSVNKQRMYKNQTVFDYMHGLMNCRGADSIVVQNDVCRDLVRDDKVIGRHGSGHIMLPYSKEA